MKKQIIKIALIIGLFLSVRGIVFAADVNLTVRDGADVVFSGAVTLPTNVINLNDADGESHTIDANSALAALASADETSPDFSISNLTYYSSFNSLYLKCLTGASGEKCDNWQYTVNNLYPSIGMDQNILAGGENIYIYFGPQNRITLDSGNITTDDTLNATAQKYDYQNNAWIIRTEVTIGLTQPDPNNPWSPIETQTSAVDGNGQATFSSIPVGSYNVGIKEDFYFPTEILTVITSTLMPGGSASCCSATPPSLPIIKAKFDLKKAFDFLVAQQKENGSFGEDIYTDWTALALASGNYQDQTIKLIKYFGESKLKNPTLTDYERHAMALMSLGLNPYDIYPASSGANNENYIEKIIAQFDGKQFGDANEDNDDIFALIVLQNAGYAQDEKMISDDISFILSRQKENGSWDESVDMTGAGIEALSAFNQNEQIKNALVKAKEFLKQNQKENGGWNNASSTAWAIEGILAMNEKPANIAIGDTPEHFDLQNIFRENWIKNGNTPLDYLATMQDSDGGIKGEYLQNKIWETAYVASALSGKTWNQIMQKFEKPNEEITKEKENRLLEEKLEKILALLEEKKIEEEKILKPAVVKITTKKPAQSIENAKNPKKSEKEDETLKLENLTSQNISQNTATALTAITDSPAQKTETPKRNWFLRFLDKIFSIF